MPARKKAAITKAKAAPKVKEYHVECGGRSNVVADFGSEAQKRKLASRIRWSYVDQPGARNKALEWIDEQIAEIRKHKSDEVDRQRAVEALTSARIDISNLEIGAEERRWDIQIDSYYDVWMSIVLYKKLRTEMTGWEGSL